MPQVIGYAFAFLLSNIGQALGLSVAAQAGLAAFGASLGTIGFGVGLTVLSAALQGAPRSANMRPSDGQQTIRQAVPARWKSYGRVRLSGPIWWFEADGLTGELYIGQALNHGPIFAIVSYHIDDATVEIDGSGNVTTAPYATAPMKILTRLGAAVETEYSEINAAFGVADVRGDGVASILLITDDFEDVADQLKNFPNGYPKLRATIDASLCFDPRDVNQVRADKTTWGWSENPVICLLNYLFDPDGYGLPWARIEGNLAQWIAAADICDEQIFSIAAAGPESLYRIAGTFLLTDRPADVVSRFLATCDGKVWQKSNGSIGISVGRFVEPTITISDRDVIAVQLTRGQDRLTRIAGVKAQFLSPEHGYREQDAEAWPDGETVVGLSEDRVANIDLTWVPSHGQARRLMKRVAVREAGEWRGTLRTNLAGLKAIDERYIRYQSDELGIDESFEVLSTSLDHGRMEMSIEIRSVAAEIDAWDPATEEGVAPSVPEGLVFIDEAEGTVIGDMTDGGGKLKELFDGRTDGNAAGSSAKNSATSAYGGKTLETPKAFGKAVIYGSKDEGFVNGSNPSVTINIRGKSGAEPADGTDGTIVGTLTFTDTSDERAGREIESIDTATQYDHLFVEITTASASKLLAVEFKLWEWRTG